MEGWIKKNLFKDCKQYSQKNKINPNCKFACHRDIYYEQNVEQHSCLHYKSNLIVKNKTALLVAYNIFF